MEYFGLFSLFTGGWDNLRCMFKSTNPTSEIKAFCCTYIIYINKSKKTGTILMMFLLIKEGLFTAGTNQLSLSAVYQSWISTTGTLLSKHSPHMSTGPIKQLETTIIPTLVYIYFFYFTVLSLEPTHHFLMNPPTCSEQKRCCLARAGFSSVVQLGCL